MAVDTGAAVNVLSEKAYHALKRAFRGNRLPPRPNDLNLMGVNSGPLDIFGIVRLPISLGKRTSIKRLDFYVASNVSLPTDGLISLMSMKSNNSNMIRYQNKSFKVMVQPMCLAFGWETSCENKVGTYQAQAASTFNVTDVSVSMYLNLSEIELHLNHKRYNMIPTIIGTL